MCEIEGKDWLKPSGVLGFSLVSEEERAYPIFLLCQKRFLNLLAHFKHVCIGGNKSIQL